MDTPPPLPSLPSEPLTEIAALAGRHVVLRPEAIDAIVLWSAVAHLHDDLDVSPFLAITSRRKRSGKSLLLDVLREIVPSPYAVGGRMGARVLASIIDRSSPTLLIDECDTFLGGDAEMRGALNASQRRSGASISRMNGTDTIQISTWCPKVLAGIGALPDTISDRSVRIVIDRRRPGAPIEPWRARDAAWGGLRERLAAWVAAVREPFGVAMRGGGVAIPPILDDRAADTWEPLIAIGDCADGRWGERARAAAVALAAPEIGPAARLAIAVLAEMDLVGETAMHSRTLIDALSATHGRISARELGGALREIGVRPRNVTRGQQAKGYYRADVAAALGAVQEECDD